MANYIKNDKNFHGARSKTRVVDNQSAKQDYHSKNKANDNHDDGWGSIATTSRNTCNGNWDDCWGEVPNKTSVPDDPWGGQDRLVKGKAERNRRFRTCKENNSFRVPIQSLPDWNEIDNEFPSLGSHKAPAVNVWEKRKQEFEEKKAIEPTNLTEEEIMIQQAIELSKMESRQEEERRRQLEEEYRLQTQLLEANPEMFDEFRLSRDEFASNAGGIAAQSSEDFNDFCDESPKDDWDYSSKKATKSNEHKKEKKKNEHRTEEEGFPQLKQNVGLPPFRGTGTQPKISKVVEMFGGWGNTNTKASAQVITETKSDSKPNKWDTVDTNFVTRPFKKSAIEDKPVSQPSTPDVLEVKLENTSNWDAIDTIDLKSVSATTPEKKNYLGTRDDVELNLKDCEPGYSLDQKEHEFATQSKRKKSKPKVDIYTEVKDNLEDCEPEYSFDKREQELATQSEVKNSKSKVDLVTGVKDSTSISQDDRNETGACFEQERDPNLNESCNGFVSEISKHGYQVNDSEKFQSISDEKNAGAKTDDSLLDNKYSDPHKSIESDYAFLLSHMDGAYAGAQLKDSNQNHAFSIEEKSDIPSNNSPPKISEATNPTFNLDYFISELNTQEGPTIPEPKPVKTETHFSNNSHLDSANSGQCNTTDINPLYGSEPSLPLKMPHTNINAPSLPTFGGFPTNAGDPSLPVGNDGVSHIEPSKAPEFMNPAFLPQPRPMMTPLMNPALMMGMNPMLMQQMMMLSNPFFVQQLQQMDMYYKSLGMPLSTGMPLFPQPMPIPGFHNPNLQAFSNTMSSGPGPTQENGMIPPTIQAPVSQLPGTEASHLDKVPTKMNQSETDSFWFQDYMSTEASPSFIPPPVNAPSNPNVFPDASTTAFASLSLNAQNTSRERLSSNGNASDSSCKSEVPCGTGWRDIDGGSESNTCSAWNNNADGWGGENPPVAISMRNSSRYVPENKAACRQPASPPYLGRHKT